MREREERERERGERERERREREVGCLLVPMKGTAKHVAVGRSIGAPVDEKSGWVTRRTERKERERER